MLTWLYLLFILPVLLPGSGSIGSPNFCEFKFYIGSMSSVLSLISKATLTPIIFFRSTLYIMANSFSFFSWSSGPSPVIWFIISYALGTSLLLSTPLNVFYVLKTGPSYGFGLLGSFDSEFDCLRDNRRLLLEPPWLPKLLLFAVICTLLSTLRILLVTMDAMSCSRPRVLSALSLMSSGD